MTDIHNKLELDAVDLLRSISEAIRALCPYSIVKIHTKRVFVPYYNSLLSIDDYPISLTISRHETRNKEFPKGRWDNWLNVSVGSIMNADGQSIKCKAKTFPYAPKAIGNVHGFNVSKIADYIIWWLHTSKYVDTIAEEEKHKKQKDALNIANWEEVKRLILDRFKIPDNVSIEATTSGIKISCTLQSGVDIADVLELLKAKE